MKYKKIRKPQVIFLKTTDYEVWFCMKGYNVWHKHTTCFDYESAFNAAMQLQNKCQCWIEIKQVEEISTYYRFYKQVGQ